MPNMRGMGIEIFAGVLAATLLGNFLTVICAYAIFWGEKKNREGFDEVNFPLWWFMAAGLPPIIGAACAYVALY